MATIRLHQNRINPLVLPVIFADKLGLFEKYQVDVSLRLAEDFIFQGKDEFIDGEVDGVMGDTTFFFYYLEEGKKAYITSTLTRTIQIVKRKGISNVSSMKVGVNRTGLFRFFVDEYLQDELKETTYTWINNTYDRISEMAKGNIDALVAIEPFISKVLREQEAEVYWHSNQIPGTFVMWCFDQAFVENNSQDVRNFHLALEESAEKFNLWSKEEKIENCMKFANYSKEAAEALGNFVFEKQQNYSVKDFNQCQEWMFRNGEIHQLYNPEKNIFKTFG